MRSVLQQLFDCTVAELICIHEHDPDTCMYFLLSGKDGKDESSGDEDEDAETKKLRGQLNSE